MYIKLLAIGKTDDAYLKTGIEKYLSRLKHYISFEMEIIADLKAKQQTHELQKWKEGEQILSKTDKTDFLILLDEKGDVHSSEQFAELINQKMIRGLKNLVFVIGGAFGFSEEVYKRANAKISLSRMTFSHQMVRLIFVEQLYRAFTILKNEPYHHQ